MSLYVDIVKKIGDFTLDVNFSTENNTVALFGLSGSGKTMTLKCIAGIMTPDSGKIVINNRIVYDSKSRINLPPQKRNVGYLPQSYALFPNLSVKENIRCGVRCKDKRKIFDIVNELIAKFKLTDIEDFYPHQLSGGQQQRVALARAFATTPDVLLLDEPFSALDNQLKNKLLYELICDINAFDSDVVFVSHDKNEVFSVCDEVCIINNGVTYASRNVDEVFNKPIYAIDAVLLEFDNILKLDDFTNDEVLIDLSSFLDRSNNNVYSSFAFNSDKVGINNLSTDLVFESEVKLIIENNTDTTLLLECKGIKAPIKASISKEFSPSFKVGDIVSFGLNRKDIYYLK